MSFRTCCWPAWPTPRSTASCISAACSGGLTVPVFTMPEFSWRAMVSSAVPLFVVTLALQNLSGVAAIRVAAYDVPISKIITLTGIAALLLAPFGAFALNLSAMTAATCMGREAHPLPDKRYLAAVLCGAIECVMRCSARR